MRTTDGLRRSAKESKGKGSDWGIPVARCPDCRKRLKLPLPSECPQCHRIFAAPSDLAITDKRL